jgi:hypothetical protein
VKASKTYGALGAGQVRELAVAASADPRTVVRVLRGERVRGLADARIRRVLKKRGIVKANNLPGSETAPRGAATS